MAQPARQLPEEDQPDIGRDAVKPYGIRGGIDGGGESSPPKRGHLSSVPDPESDTSQGGDEAASPQELGNSENRGGLYSAGGDANEDSPTQLKNSEEAAPGSGIYNPEGDRRGRLVRLG